MTREKLKQMKYGERLYVEDHQHVFVGILLGRCNDFALDGRDQVITINENGLLVAWNDSYWYRFSDRER